MASGSLGKGVISPEHFRPVSWQPWKLPPYLALAMLSVHLGATYDGPLELAVKALLLVVGSLQLIGIFGLMHEAAHGHLLPTPRGNRLVGEVMSVIVGTSWTGYRIAHLTHHSAFRTERDPQEVIFPRRGPVFTAAYLVVAATVGAPVFLLVKAPLIAFQRRGLLRAVWAPLAALALYTTLVMSLPGRHAQFLLMLIPTAWVLGSLNDIVYHQGLTPDDTLAACSSFDSDVFGQLFLSGANRHAEHHAYPAVPGPRLVGASRELRPHLEAVGVPYERGFIQAFARRLLVNPGFLPLASESERPRTTAKVHS